MTPQPEHPIGRALVSAGPAPGTLSDLVRPDAVEWPVLRERYGSLLDLVEVLIGVVPNCDRYLEIWPPAFRTYNLMVPNLLNLPLSLFGVASAPRGVLGLGMYASSRAASCPYCSAHTCSFALRRGAEPETVAAAASRDAGRDRALGPGEQATVAVAEALGVVPGTLAPALRADLVRAYGEGRAEWIVFGIVMMGFLNKFMDAMGVELEPSTTAEVKDTIGDGWSTGAAGWGLPSDLGATPAPQGDTLGDKLRVLPMIPTALRLDARWQRGMPGRWPDVGRELRARTGHDFPLLGLPRHHRPVRAIASMIAQNLDASTTVIGLPAKVLVGSVFAEVADDDRLRADVDALAAQHGQQERVETVRRWARTEEAEPPIEGELGALLVLARAASPTPAAIDAPALAACRDASLSSAAVVEVVTWIAVLQLLHRLGAYVDVA